MSSKSIIITTNAVIISSLLVPTFAKYLRTYISSVYTTNSFTAVKIKLCSCQMSTTMTRCRLIFGKKSYYLAEVIMGEVY